ncbi:MAG: diacylglycerol kinase family lipid kinase [Chloroflexi bacterium]|nr:diacylglycerol kinase family lipid kinase [Chloroflexota bacterium]MCI0648397.1 diacylglycerol kinase family lipid kinase [Chloroflexota bacterium]MCI0727518.1 diacylglycerol kinase family lipid kinase [Chloroflexota bacterium]
MKATLIYNANSSALPTNKVAWGELLDALEEAGYDAIYKATACEEDLDKVLVNVEGVVVAAGGDGTVRAVARRLLNKNVGLTPLPMGTANNICRALGLTGPPLDIIHGLRQFCKQAFDVGRVSCPGQDSIFLEGMGYGFFADALTTYRPEKGRNLFRVVDSLLETLREYQPYYSRLTLDGQDISGDYLLVEVLNTAAIGPRLKFAPEANPGDGLFDVVRIHKDEHASLVQYTASLLAEKLEELPNVEVVQGCQLHIAWNGFPVHVDDEVFLDRPDEGEDSPPNPFTITVEIMPGALEFWLPETEDDNDSR